MFVYLANRICALSVRCRSETVRPERLSEIYKGSPSPPKPFSFLLHTYLVEMGQLKNWLHCDTSPSLHIEAARIVGFPSGTPSALFLIALPMGITFH